MFCVVGADGFFGSYMLEYILSHNDKNEDIIALNHSRSIFEDSSFLKNISFELKDKSSVTNAAEIISRYKDIKIFYTAAAHNPDIIKNNPGEALEINTECYSYFLSIIKNADIKKLIYTSSDTVYGESVNSHSFSENDSPEPVNIYGHQKLAAEKITAEAGFTAARYPYMAGASLSPYKKHFFDSIADKLKNGEKIYMFTDYIRSSISYKTAAELTFRLMTQKTDAQIFNICADKAVSKYDIGLKIADYIKADKTLVVPSSMKDSGVFSERRAGALIMDNSLIKNTLNIKDPIKLEF